MKPSIQRIRARAFTKGLIALRKSTAAFRMDNMEEVKNRVKLLTVPGENGVEERGSGDWLPNHCQQWRCLSSLGQYRYQGA